tara:strand:- start:10 stop:351 length:342 start_codon:yes stop_codon:yes gene_type:complete
MEVQGKIKLKGDVQTFGADFTKRQLVVTTDEQYPQLIAIDFVKDKCSLLDSHNIGDNVKVFINLGGREWVNPEGVAKYFNSIVGWRIEKAETAPSVPQAPVQQLEEVQDDLPF